MRTCEHEVILELSETVIIKFSLHHKWWAVLIENSCMMLMQVDYVRVERVETV